MLIYAHIVDYNILKVFVKNDINHIMSLSRKVKLKIIIDYKAARYYVIDFVEHNLITKTSKRSLNWIKSDLRKFITAAITFIIIITFAIAETKKVYITKITLHNTSEIRFSIFVIINEFSFLWQDIENVKNVSESKWINISLFNNWREFYKSDQTRVYSLNQKNKNIIDKKFDKLHVQDRMKWIVIATLFSFSCFVIWKTISKRRKDYMIINIRALNRITILNAYSMSSQIDIFIAIKNVKFIFTINAASFFYQ